MNKTILAFGEVLWDILPSCTVLGGAPFNFIYRVNSLGDTALMISRLGRDELGRKAHEQIIQSGLDTRFIQWDDELPTGTVQVSFDEQNNPDYFIVPNVAYDRIETTGELIDTASTADCLCFGTLSQRAAQSRKTIERLLEEAATGLKLLDSTCTIGIDIGACAMGIQFTGACTTAAISMDAATFAAGDHEIEMRNTVTADKTVICAGTAANDGDIVTAVGADADIADGSLYMSAVDGAGKLFIKVNDTWTEMTVEGHAH